MTTKDAPDLIIRFSENDDSRLDIQIGDWGGMYFDMHPSDVEEFLNCWIEQYGV